MSKSANVPVDTIRAEVKAKDVKSLDDDVEVYASEAEEGQGLSDHAKQMAKNKREAAAHAKEVRGRPVNEIFENRMRLPGGTSPIEAGAAVVKLKEDVNDTMTKEKRRERNGIWTQKFLEWVKTYGKEVRSAGGALIGLGDRIEVLPNGHYRFKW